MRRPLGRAALACALAVLAWAPAATGRADEPTPSPAPPGHVVDQAELDKVLEEVRQELAESSEAMVQAAADLRLAERALPGAKATFEHARQLLAQAQRRQERTARERGRAQVRYMLSSQQAEQQATQVAEQQARIGRLARAVYQGGSQLGNVSVLLEARSPADFAERLVAFQTVLSSQRSTLADLQTAQQSFGTRTDDLERERDALAAADEQAQRDLAAVVELTEQARAAEIRVTSLVAARKAALAAAAAAQAQEDIAHRHLAGESAALQGTLSALAKQELGKAGARDGSTVPPRPGLLGRPVPGPVSSPFGMRVHPITGVYKLHTGVDISAPCGTPILAARAGTVVQAGWHSAYGWRTVVSHGAVRGVLLTTTYNHQTRLGASVGDKVAAGQQIGTVGSTGYSTGCHLHLELYVNAAMVDPAPWLT